VKMPEMASALARDWPTAKMEIVIVWRVALDMGRELGYWRHIYV
jgi:hypothetical protein